ncbi:MAG: trypsin-like peptidase domain-containing protein [bacterium]|nr:trypsin-like serine protease [Gammaproteobacteria bacterium]HIL96246.1 trypsin-like serine protease [Pseudomonadales bacterium]
MQLASVNLNRLVIFVALAGLSTSLAAKDYSRLFAKVDPTVVEIKTSESQLELSEEGVVNTTSHGLGSGVIITKGGLILTASHVVHDANEVTVELLDGRTFSARVLSSIITADIALIEIVDSPGDLPAARIGDSNDINTGEEVFVVGAPYGLSHTLTTGNLSGRRIHEDEIMFEEMEFLQTDAAINQGNSGGPLFSANGELIGIVSHIQTQTGGSVGLGFAASINMAKKLVLDRPALWWGMRYLPLTNDALRVLNVPDYSEGLLIQHVTEGSLAAAFNIHAGVIPMMLGEQKIMLGGDVIVEVGGHNLYQTRAGFERIQTYINSVKKGDELEITVFREGEKKILTAIKP